MHDSLFPRTLAMDWGIPFLSGRPHRDTKIDVDDVFNLRIALGLHHDVLDVCADPHLFAHLSGNPDVMEKGSVLTR
jgi:hypothetical protein